MISYPDLDAVHDAMSKLRKIDLSTIGACRIPIVDMDDKHIADIVFNTDSYQWYVDWAKHE